jgi:hypothetical protein
VSAWNIPELCAAAQRRHKSRGERLGQALYNEAYSRNPAVAHLAGGEFDPFYRDENIPSFLDTLTGLKTPPASPSLPPKQEGS